MKPFIEVKDVTRRFGDLVAVDHVNFAVEQGEIFGFLGPNGAGKTTTVRMLTGIIDPTEGSATIQDHDICTEPLLARAHIAVVPEEANVYLDLSVWQNIMLMAELYGIPRERRIHEGKRLLGMLGLTEKTPQKARTLSKGLRQRLMLCAALITEPEVLFLDEPTSGLDVASSRMIRKIVNDLNRNGLTVFLTTHNMGEASEMCSRVAIINRGRIVAIDTPEKLRSTMVSRQFVKIRFASDVNKRTLALLAGVSEVEMDDLVYRLYTKVPGEVLTEVVKWADREGLTILDLGTQKPSLEDVFLHITSERKEGSLQ